MLDETSSVRWKFRQEKNRMRGGSINLLRGAATAAAPGAHHPGDRRHTL
jgi:hypothetical protein